MYNHKINFVLIVPLIKKAAKTFSTYLAETEQTADVLTCNSCHGVDTINTL